MDTGGLRERGHPATRKAHGYWGAKGEGTSSHNGHWGGKGEGTSSHNESTWTLREGGRDKEGEYLNDVAQYGKGVEVLPTHQP